LGIAVHGQLRAYLVSADKFQELQSRANRIKAGQRSQLRGSLTIVGDLELGSRKASQTLAEAVRVSAADL
jgi:hypothetical protein